MKYITSNVDLASNLDDEDLLEKLEASAKGGYPFYSQQAVDLLARHLDTIDVGNLLIAGREYGYIAGRLQCPSVLLLPNTFGVYPDHDVLVASKRIHELLNKPAPVTHSDGAMYDTVIFAPSPKVGSTYEEYAAELRRVFDLLKVGGTLFAYLPAFLLGAYSGECRRIVSESSRVSVSDLPSRFIRCLSEAKLFRATKTKRDDLVVFSDSAEPEAIFSKRGVEREDLKRSLLPSWYI